MVFWAANPAAAGKTGVENMPQKNIDEDSMLMGFTVGDESTIPTLKITDVDQPVALQNGMTQGSHCIGCHTGTPDGDYVAFVDAWPWGAAFAGVKPGITGGGAARLYRRTVQGLEQLRRAEDVRAVSVERADDVFARALGVRRPG